MSIVVDGKRLRMAIEHAVLVIKHRSARRASRGVGSNVLPVLGTVLLRAGEGAMTVSATDLYRRMQTTVEATGESGAVLLPPRPLIAFLRGVRGGEMFRITATGKQARIAEEHGRRALTINGDFATGDFPKMPDVPAHGWQNLPSDFARSLVQVTPFISTDDTRASVNSLLLRTNGEKLTLAACDGHRLAVAELKWSGQFSKDVLVPLDAALAISKLPLGSARVVVDDTNLHLRAGSSCFSVKLVEAAFPPYEQVIPNDIGRAIFHADRAALLPMLARFRDLTKANGHGGIKVTASGGRLIMEGPFPDGTVSDELPIEYDGPDKTVGVNAGYMLDTLRAIDTDTACLMIADGLEPVKILSDSAKFQAIVMPFRI